MKRNSLITAIGNGFVMCEPSDRCVIEVRTPLHIEVIPVSSWLPFAMWASVMVGIVAGFIQ